MIVAAVGALALAGCSAPEAGVLAGSVMESSGAPCADCAIGLTPLTPGVSVIELAQYTDSEGTFRVERLQPGEYRVTVFRDGSSAEQRAVVEPGRTTVVDLDMP
ncbi:carboxypeptidase-like regulatory domain-containing protein [Cellulomonas sp. PS-H5]|uniref:carboxypeptidase-like regulatory domain-containing protein n=1 Tax=Cellulomonas sp. PS-H5 TaxID=2820400 RepID=UPI001C501AA5|nr:carboxypeptidase-like regulatory domain-containing protein [Cellulomonas sp. PS-H5]MBW0256282.1 carboxypeptidase-like regulatory domain-containing protein [Cellulomonas sp. PS-H5]